eukprot:6214365-Pleurochrysis_carterae.AAC.1
MNSFPNIIAFASHAYFPSATRAPLSKLWKLPLLAHGRRRPLSALDRSRSRRCTRSPRLRCSLTNGSWY